MDTLKKALQTFFEGVEVVGEANGLEEAYQGILASGPNLVFLDIEMVCS